MYGHVLFLTDPSTWLKLLVQAFVQLRAPSQQSKKNILQAVTTI